VVVEYEVLASVTSTGVDPASAVFTVIWVGEPDTVICAWASLVQSATTASTAARLITRTVIAVVTNMTSDPARDGVRDDTG
jgi:hypothetical protein